MAQFPSVPIRVSKDRSRPGLSQVISWLAWLILVRSGGIREQVTGLCAIFGHFQLSIGLRCDLTKALFLNNKGAAWNARGAYILEA